MKQSDRAPILARKVKVSSVFIDESGAKNSAGGFFVVGFVKSRKTPTLARDMRDVRQKHRHYEEAKFGRINRNNTGFYFDLAEMLAAADVRIGGSVYDSRRHFPSNEPTWKVQARMSAQLVLGNLNRGELLDVFVDLVQTPRRESVAKLVRERVNGVLGQRVVVASYDFDSQSTDLLQLADLVAGAIAYERRQWTGDTPDAPGEAKTPKAQVSARLRRAFGLDSFADVHRGKVNILTMKTEPKPLPGFDLGPLA